jgi:hypothetical protein
LVGRKDGGHQPTIYQTILQLEFDEGEELLTEPFHLMISGPIIWEGGYQARGPSAEEWGMCQADNIKRLDRIGYNYRPMIDAPSRKYVEAVSPGIFDLV